MKKINTKRKEAFAKVDADKLYTLNDAIALAKDAAYANFDESFDVAFRLGVDPRHADQMIRGAIVMPAGTGKKVNVVVITSGENIAKAEAAGADVVGGDDIIQKIQGGWMEFDRVIATPDMMGKIGRVARILGPRGLMPNPKLGTVTTDVEKAVKEQKAGKVEYRTEKTGIIHIPFGKKSFDNAALTENFAAIAGAITRAKPASAKGTYMKSVTISTTMGPGIKLDTNDIANILG
ncbi:MAG: 50S ribosomal protein L1 [Bacteriovoracaceae bacterium]|jgi:large subunit ribosomal protein L1|nr:50S ribosomal protein L1 [Bacteriovoracaceae bacterium]